MRNLLLAALISAAISPVALADMVAFTPSDPDIKDLDHTKYVTWGLEIDLAATQEIVAATLRFENIRNWKKDEPNILYIQLLDYAKKGLKTRTDNQDEGNEFADDGYLLTTFVNLPHTPQDLVYQFTQEQLDLLNIYAADGNFGLGFDPDCHFYNDGVTLELVSGTSVPEPTTASLLMLLTPLALRRRR